MIDLHTHSTASDGCYTPTELVDLAFEKGIKVMAITDHDTVSGLEEGEKEARKKNIEFVRGIELSVEWPTGEFHLLGLALKDISKSLSELISNQKLSRENRNRCIVEKVNQLEKMQNLGLKVTLEELQEKYGTKNIGRPHIADYLFENKIVKTRQKAFDLYLAHGRPLYEKKEKCNLDEAIVAICDSGGVPVLAHPLSLYLSWGKLQELLPELHERGIEGLEAWHPGTKLGEAKRLEELAFKNGFFVTAGSDFHGERVRKDRHLGHTTKDIKIDDRFYYEQLLPHLARG